MPQEVSLIRIGWFDPEIGTTPVSKTQAFSYNVFKTGTAAKNLTLSYKVPGRVVEQLTLGFLDRRIVSKSQSFTYTVRMLAIKTLPASYRVRVVYSKTLPLAFYVHLAVGQSRSFSYQIFGIKKRLTPTYNVRHFLATSMQVRWNTKIQVLKGRTFTFPTRRIVIKSLKLSNTEIARVTKQLQMGYSIKQRIPRKVTPSYVVYKTISKNRPLGYTIRTTVPARSLTTSYRVRARVGRSQSFTFYIRNVARKNLILPYVIITQSTLPRQLTLSYHTRGTLGKSMKFQYSIQKLTTVSKTLSVSYVVHNRIHATRPVGYAIQRRLAKQATYPYYVTTAVFKQFDCDYKINTGVYVWDEIPTGRIINGMDGDIETDNVLKAGV